MTQCPNCGAAVSDGAAVCGSCGTALGAEVGTDELGHQQPGHGQSRGSRAQTQQPGGRQDQPHQQQGQPPQQDRGQQPPQPGRGHPPNAQYGQQQRARGNDDMVAGLSRRQVLGIGGGVAAVAVGWYFISGGADSAGETPTGTAEAFVNALNNGNGQRATELLHPNSPVPESVIQQLAQRYDQASTSIESIRVTEESEGQATVEVMLSGVGSPMRIRLRPSNGNWRVYSFPGPS